MKSLKLLFSLLFLSMFLLTSCDDDDNEVTVDDITGEWKIETMNYTVDSSVSGEVSGQEIDQSNVTVGEMLNSDYFITFTDDNFSTMGSYDIDATGTQTDPINGTVTSDLSSTFSDVNGEGTYTRSGNVLIFIGTFVEFDFDITEFDVDGLGIDLDLFEELGIEFPEINFDEFDLEDQESEGTITSFDGNSMTMEFNTEETSTENGVTNSTVVEQTLTLTRQ